MGLPLQDSLDPFNKREELKTLSEFYYNRPAGLIGLELKELYMAFGEGQRVQAIEL
jgi:hypothetical protein